MNPFPKTATTVKIPKMSGMGACWCGRRGMPREWIMTMYADYQAGLSLEQVAEKYGRTRQSIFDIFKRRGLALRARKFLPPVLVDGRKFTEQKTCGKHRYLRNTVRRDKVVYLHHLVWEKAHGPIPPGHKVAFKDGNHRNCALDNLELLTNSDQVRKYASKGQNQFTKVAKARLASLLQGNGSGLATLRRTR